ncbi:hypothetical protein [Sulfurimonas sp.]
MNEELDKLKNIGAQRIYEDTHIPIEHVQAILHESFDGLTKIQFVGFISILEREYGNDLTTLKESGVTYFDELHSDELENINDDGIFIAPTKNQNSTLMYILIAIAMFMVVAYMSLDSSQEDENITKAVAKNPIIEDVKENIDIENIEVNESNASVAESTLIQEKPQKTLLVQEKEKVLPSTLKIVSDGTKLWVGYIELESNKKYQKTFDGELDLDPTKNWLIILGHGYVDFILGDEIKKFDAKKDVRFLYKDGELKPISKDEFIELNRGSSW